MHLQQLVQSERPRERLLSSSADSLSTTELLAILLGTGSARENALELASRLLSAYGLARLSTFSCAELAAVHGIGEAKAARIVAAFELGRRTLSRNAPERISAPEDAIAYVRPLIGHLEQEHFLVIFLNAKNHILGSEIVTKGIVDASLIHPREVFRDAIAHGARSVIVAHNHPSGDSTPSEEDRQTTEILRAAGEILGIPLLDHVIVTANGGRSVMD